MSDTSTNTTEANPADLYETLQEEVEQVLIGNEDIVESITIAALTGGHILLEGVPGVAKTTIANLFARASGLSYNRIQMTPDVLPADITGSNVYRETTGEFQLQRGPIFANVVVADEINRATPKTQSALLEAMQERRVTIEGQTLRLPSPFLVIATQNPIEMEGTFQLPEAQRDRFQQRLTINLPTREIERGLIDRIDTTPDLGADLIDTVVDPEQIIACQDVVTAVHVADSIREYVLDIVHATRSSPDIQHGASPRASIAFLNTAKARAAIRGRDYVIPDDINALAEGILSHRLVLSTDAELNDTPVSELVNTIVSETATPSAVSQSA